MNLLICDDEKLTRDGLTFGIDWAALGIDHVEAAADGMDALRICRTFSPDILLTDVRMPRLDGIQLSERLQSRFPHMIILFMSGYSDREYLKAAIRLRAVEYVEKPIDMDQIRSAVSQAVDAYREHMASAEYHSYSLRQEEAALAQALTHQNADTSYEGCPLTADMRESSCCVTFLLQCYNLSPESAFDDTGIEKLLTAPLMGLHAHSLFAPHRLDAYILHLFFRDSHAEEQISDLGNQMASALLAAGLTFHLAAGRAVRSADLLYKSYNDAVISLQNAFFREAGSFLPYEKAADRSGFADLSGDEAEAAFRRLLPDFDSNSLHQYADDLLSSLQQVSVLPNQVRDLYYRLFSILADTTAGRQMDAAALFGHSSIWEGISSSISIYDLHRLFIGLIDTWIRASADSKATPTTVALIENYIAGHYGDPGLSINAISEHVHLSSSYVCTLFRSQTGKTLSQHITDYRMEKARQLLSDPRNRIQEVAEAVGYADSNYFSKAFRKVYGVSPSEFRGGKTS